MTTGRGAAKTSEPVKDPDASHPVPTAWRPFLTRMVAAFVRKDYGLEVRDACVKRPTKDISKFMRDYVASYGETLAELPEETWRTSENWWYAPFWEAFVDLWTVESGRSDMVFHVRATPLKSGEYRFEALGIYVP